MAEIIESQKWTLETEEIKARVRALEKVPTGHKEVSEMGAGLDPGF